MTTLAPALPRRSLVAEAAPRVVLQVVSWRAYEQVVEALGETHARLTYDSGTLEIMSPSPEHESHGRNFLRIVDLLAEICGLDHMALGSSTFKREAKEKGLEPDECFYFANWAKAAGKDRLDLDVDPPPDLAIEVDIMSSSLDRRSICAALNVPEIWCFDGEAFEVLVLGADGAYRRVERSPTFPAIDIEGIVPFLELGRTEPFRSWAPQFRAWVRQRLGREA